MSSSTGSFIPSSPVDSRPARRVRKIYVITYIVYVFFAVTVITALALFGYSEYLGKKIDAAKQDLAARQSSFNSSTLDEISKLESRLDQANVLFNKQVSLYNVLVAVEDVTLNSVNVVGFEYSDVADTVTLKMSAKLPDFNAAAYQRTVLSNHPVFEQATIENIAYGSPETGGVQALTFDIIVPLDTDSLRPAAVETYDPMSEEVDTASLNDVATSSAATSTNDI